MNTSRGLRVALGIATWLGLSFVFMWPPVVWEAQSCRNACVNNRRQIEAAKEQWALEKAKTNGTPVVLSEVNEYMKGAPICPDGGTYDYGLLGQTPTCSLGRKAPRESRH